MLPDQALGCGRFAFALIDPTSVSPASAADPEILLAECCWEIMTQPPDAHYIRLEQLADLALFASLEDRIRLEHTIRVVCRARMAIEHSSRVVEQAEHQLERLEAMVEALAFVQHPLGVCSG